MGACHRTLQEVFAPEALAAVRLAAIYIRPPPCQHRCYAPVTKELTL